MEVLLCSHPSLLNPCRTSEGENWRQPSSRNKLPATYQLSPLAFEPPCSNSPALRPKLPPLTWSVVPGWLRPSLVSMEIAPPSVLSPNSGFDPGIIASSDIAIL